MTIGNPICIPVTMVILLYALPAFASTESRIASDKYFGCQSREYFEKLVRLAVQKDEEAFKKRLLAGVLSKGMCVPQERERIFISDTTIFSDSSK